MGGPAQGINEGAYVFVCYSHEDANYVRRLTEHLHAHDVETWYDRHLERGALWRQQIERRILGAASVVVVMTPSAKASREVQGEVDLALDRGRPVLGLLLDGDVWYQLKPLQYEDVTGGRLPSPAFVAQLRRNLGPPVPPPELWERSDVLDILASRDVAQLFRLVQSTTGGTQTQVGALVGLSAAEVDEIMSGSRVVTSVDQLALIAAGLDMSEQARTTLFLGQRPSSVPVRAIPVQREPTSRRFSDVIGVYASRSAFATAYPTHDLFDGAGRVDAVGLSLNILCQQYSDTGLYNLAARGTQMQLLLLDPYGDAIKRREREEGYEPGYLSSLNVLNLGVLKRVRDRLPPQARDNLQIGLYDETVRFNVILLDERLCVAQPYLPHERGVESPTLVIERDPSRSGLYNIFEHVFTSTWEGGRPL